MDYKVDPGLYAIGNPDENSIVLVSANYKLSFDVLRRELEGIDGWILVLDTKGINVWCAAGKGTFGTKELVNRIEVTGLKNLVSHRKLLVPQLGATGVSAHKVKEQSGFLVKFGPIRASDIKAYLDAGWIASPDMRQVRFSFYDRLVVVPMEIMIGLKYLLWLTIGFLILSGLSRKGFSLTLGLNVGIRSIINLVLAYVAGTVVGPLLLPWLPGRTFSSKGMFAGIAIFLLSFFAL
jgi:acetyl-CoA decarbonylase/synthase complex subunit gamma